MLMASKYKSTTVASPVLMAIISETHAGTTWIPANITEEITTVSKVLVLKIPNKPFLNTNSSINGANRTVTH